MTVSCEKYMLPRLECDTDTIWAPIEGGLYNVTLTSNVRWAFDGTTIEKWIYIDVTNGQSDYEDVDYKLQVKVSANDTESDRECVMEYSSTTLAHKLVVEQAGPEVPEDEGEEETESGTGE